MHVSHIRPGMVTDPGKEVSRNQTVKVKVISMTATKMALSMKEVNQQTGEDLLPSRGREGLEQAAEDIRNSVVPTDSTEINRGLDLGALRAKMDEDEEKGKNKGKKVTKGWGWSRGCGRR